MLPYVVVLLDRLDAVLRRLVPDRDPARPGSPVHTAEPGVRDERQHDHLPRARRGGRRCSSGTACRSRSSRSAPRSALWATGVLDLEQALAGFGDPAVLFIASLFVVSEALEATGVTAWAGQELIAQVGESRVRLLVLTCCWWRR